ncbi:unnamed protein product, partial [marine sediment metagenome]
LTKKRFREIVEKLVALKIPEKTDVMGFCRSNVIYEEDIKLLKQLNYKCVRFGAETGSEVLLKRLKGDNISIAITYCDATRPRENRTMYIPRTRKAPAAGAYSGRNRIFKITSGHNIAPSAMGEAAANITAEYFTKNLLLVFLSVPSRVILAVAGLPILAIWPNKSAATATICQAAAYPPSSAVPLKDFNAS